MITNADFWLNVRRQPSYELVPEPLSAGSCLHSQQNTHNTLSAMAANVSSDGLRKRTANGQSKVLAPSEEGKKIDQKLDQHLE